MKLSISQDVNGQLYTDRNAVLSTQIKQGEATRALYWQNRTSSQKCTTFRLHNVQSLLNQNMDFERYVPEYGFFRQIKS